MLETPKNLTKNILLGMFFGFVLGSIAYYFDLIKEHDLSLAEVREVVISDMLNDQQLPIDRTLHP